MKGKQSYQDRRQAGITIIGALVGLPFAVVAGFVLLKFGMAAVDVMGLEKDLTSNIAEMSYTCVASACEDDLFDEIETLMTTRNRKVTLYWDAIDWSIDDNSLIVPGFAIVDLMVYQFRWEFEYRIQTMI